MNLVILSVLLPATCSLRALKLKACSLLLPWLSCLSHTVDWKTEGMIMPSEEQDTVEMCVEKMERRIQAESKEKEGNE